MIKPKLTQQRLQIIQLNRLLKEAVEYLEEE
jgi:hypothetical protein